MRLAKFVFFVFLCTQFLLSGSVREPERLNPPLAGEITAAWLIPDIRLDTGDSPGVNRSHFPQISSFGDHVYVTWEDYRNGSADIYFTHSADRGATWQAADIRLDTGDSPGAHNSGNPQISSSGDHVYVTWFDSRNGNYDIYFNYSADRGATWQAVDTRLDTGDSPGANFSLELQISSFGDHVYVTWMDYRNRNYDIYFNYSADRGATWQASATRLDTGDSPGAGASRYPQISSSGDHVYVTWEDCRNGSSDIYFTHSADRGATWQASATRLDTGDSPGASYSYNPQINCSGDHVYVTWIDGRNGEPDIYFTRSADRGVTWQASDTRLDTGDTPGANDSRFPQIGCSKYDVYVTWQDERNGAWDIYITHSADRGATWQAAATRLDTGDSPGAHYSSNPQIGCSGDHALVTWFDNRNGDWNIYFNTTNTVPRAKAGMDETLRTGTPYTLDGAASSDPDGDALTFFWSILQKPAASGATLSDARSARASFTPDQPGEYRFRLTVTDAFGAIDSDTVLITADEIFELTIQATTGGNVTPGPGTYTHNRGESVLLTATADAGFVFHGWSGDATGTANPLTVVMSTDKSIRAGFRALVHAPMNLTGERIENRSLSMAEYIARLTWSAHPDNFDITGYRVTRVEAGGEVTLAVVGGAIFTYEDFGVPQSGDLTYRVVALRADGHESDPAVVTIH